MGAPDVAIKVVRVHRQFAERATDLRAELALRPPHAELRKQTFLFQNDGRAGAATIGHSRASRTDIGAIRLRAGAF